MVFALCYAQHGGSGLSFTYDNVMDLSLSDMRWYAERLSDARRTEASRIRAANKPKKG